MRLDYLRYFDHLANVLNYTRAAEDLYIAQPTLSVAMKRMEKELGIKLFRRGEKGTHIELTETGAAFHEYVALALKNYDKGLRVAREIQGGAEFLGEGGHYLRHAGPHMVAGHPGVHRHPEHEAPDNDRAGLFARAVGAC